MADSIYTFDPVAANNTSLDSIPYGPNQLYHNQIDNWFRSLASKLAQFVDDLGAVNTVAGTGDAVTVTLASGITAYATGQFFKFIAGAANTGAATLNVNSIGAKAIRKISGGTDVALVAGDLAAGVTYEVVYRATANSAAGAWVLVGSSVASATTSQAGIVELATLAETLAGTDTSRAVVPAGLAFAISGYATTATAAGTTTLTAASEPQQYFTGTTTQTVVLPVTSTLNLGRPFRIVNNSTGAVTVQSSGANTILILAPGAAAVFTCILTSGTTAASWEARPIGITLGTAVASTSGTSIDFTSIPSWVRQIVVSFDGVSTSGAANILFQIGDSGGVENTGYLGAGSVMGAATVASTLFTAGFGLGSASTAAIYQGSVTFTLVDASTNTWAAQGMFGRSDSVGIYATAGGKSLSATLDRVRVTTSNGTDTFDAGKINIAYL